MMDHEILTLFSLEEFTDLSHGMTARSTKSKRKADIPKDENWEVTNQPPLNTEKRSPFYIRERSPLSSPERPYLQPIYKFESDMGE